MADRTNIRFPANENFPAPAIRKLRAAGVDVVAVIEALPSASDQAVMAYARQEQRKITQFRCLEAFFGNELINCS
jgi:hypothetical protein